MSDIVVKEDINQVISEYADTFLKSKGLTKQEMSQFLQLAKGFQLNPFKREIYCIKYGNKCNILVGYEVYLKRAERTGKLDGWRVDLDDSNKDLKAIITIHRKDWEHPFVHEVWMSEYKQETQIWKQKPKTMIRKVAISQGMRMVFSEDCGGMPYAEEEMPPGEVIDIKHDIKNSPAKIAKTPKESKVEVATKYIRETKFIEGLNITEAKLADLALNKKEKEIVGQIYLAKKSQLEYEDSKNDPAFQKWSKDVDEIGEKYANERNTE